MKKKRNKVLEILICTALAAVLFFAYMVSVRDDGRFALVDLEGNRSALDGFAFEGIGGDETYQIHFTVKDGEVEQEFYPVDSETVNTILKAEAEGDRGIRKYFRKSSLIRDSFYVQTDSAPLDFTKTKPLKSLEDLNEENRTKLKEESMDTTGYELSGFISESAEIFGEITDYSNGKEARFSTGMTLDGGEFYFAEWEDTAGTSSKIDQSLRDLEFCAVNMQDAFYGILATDERCKGEVSLLRIPKEAMTERHGSWDETRFTRKTYGKAEELKRFPVDETHQIIGFTEIGEQRLLLARSEGDRLLLELYDLEGNLVHREDTDVTEVSKYEMDYVTVLQKEDYAVLQFELSQRIWDEAQKENQFHYEVVGNKGYLIEDAGIAPLDIKYEADYVDVQKGKLLQISYEGPKENTATSLWGYEKTDYRILVTDEKTGQVLYQGKLETDFFEDYARKLSTVSVGQKAGYLRSREKVWEEKHFNDVHIRSVSGLQPMDGENKGFRWNRTDQWNREREFR